MPDLHERAAQLAQQRWGDTPRERALLLPVPVLRPVGDRRPVQRGRGPGERGNEGRTNTPTPENPGAAPATAVR